MSPGPAHGLATRIAESDLPLRGRVVTASNPSATGCVLLLHAADKMGNLCTRGGATVTCGCRDHAVESHCTDMENGTYKLEWRSQKSGVYQVHIQIDGLHVVGSPAPMRLYSGVPDFGQTRLSGSALTSAVAGKEAVIAIQCLDAYARRAARTLVLWCGSVEKPQIGVVIAAADSPCVRAGADALTRRCPTRARCASASR